MGFLYRLMRKILVVLYLILKYSLFIARRQKVHSRYLIEEQLGKLHIHGDSEPEHEYQLDLNGAGAGDG